MRLRIQTKACMRAAGDNGPQLRVDEAAAAGRTVRMYKEKETPELDNVRK